LFKKQIAAGGSRMKQILKEQLEYLRSQYPPGTRVELISMNDPYSSLQSGDQGTVAFVDDIGTVHVNWDCGSGLGLVYGGDSYKQI
jgi:hypothetical protein